MLFTHQTTIFRKFIAMSVVICFGLMLTSTALAQTQTLIIGSETDPVPGGRASQTSLPNPLAGAGNIQQIIGNMVASLLAVTGSLALAMFVFGGFTWVTSGGSPEKVKKGKDVMVWASLGLAVILLSYALVVLVVSALGGSGQA